MRFWFGCLLLAIAACKRQDDVELALDPGISLYALITLDPEGALLGSTPLGPSPEPRSFVTSPDFTNLIAGYDQADFGEAPLARLSGEGCSGRGRPSGAAR